MILGTGDLGDHITMLCLFEQREHSGKDSRHGQTCGASSNDG